MLEFKLHIERQFKSGMSWDNYGKVWQLDHRIPCALFNLEDPFDVARCFNYLNYQPLESHENMSKRHRLQIDTQIPLGL